MKAAVVEVKLSKPSTCPESFNASPLPLNAPRGSGINTAPDVVATKGCKTPPKVPLPKACPELFIWTMDCTVMPAGTWNGVTVYVPPDGVRRTYW